MIRFELVCDKTHAFDGWFRSNEDFQMQCEKGLLSCPICNSHTVRKVLMTPALPKKDNQKPAHLARLKQDVLPKMAIKQPKQASAVVNSPVLQKSLSDLPVETRSKMIDALRQWRQAVVDQSENVGTQFAEEVRKIHYKEAIERPIYGEAKFEDVTELLEEGIDCLPLPILPEDHN